MQHVESNFSGADGLTLYAQTWLPAVTPRALVAIVHGFGEHSGRYPHVVEGLTAQGYAIYGFDHRGHGRSPGQRGHINRFEEYREDVHAFLQWVQAQTPNQPLFVLGHSMGAFVVLSYLLHTPMELRGAIISAAPIEPAGVAKPHIVAMSRALSRLWPTLPISLNLELAAISRDPAAVQAYRTDPLVHGRASVRWGAECLAELAWVKQHAANLKLPLLIIHGEADRINLVAGSRWLFAQAMATDKTLLTYPGGYHELHNDLDHAQVVNDIGQWLERRNNHRFAVV